MKPWVDHEEMMIERYRKNPLEAQEMLVEALHTWDVNELAVLLKRMIIAFPPSDDAVLPGEDEPSLNSFAAILSRVGVRMTLECSAAPADASQPIPARAA